MSRCLNEHDIERYRQGALSPTERLTVTKHIAECESCRQRLFDEQKLQAKSMSLLSFLLEETDEEMEHLSYELMSGYLSDELDATDRELVEIHLEVCPQCADELRDLRAFRAKMSTYPAEMHAPIAPLTLREKVSAVLPHPSRWFRLIQTVGAATAPVLIVMVCWLGYENVRLQQRIRQIPSALQGTQIPLNDGGGRLIADESGLVRVQIQLQPLPPEVKSALMRQKVNIPSSLLTQLIGERKNLSGKPDGAFDVQSPVGTVVLSDQPTCSWTPAKGATNYIVSVFELGNPKPILPPKNVSKTQWKPKKPLPRGKVLFWQVEAFKGNERIDVAPKPSAPPAQYMVLKQDEATKLEEAKQTYANSPLTKGILYAEQGLLDDAERELQRLLQDNPNSTLAEKLLNDVRRLRPWKLG